MTTRNPRRQRGALTIADVAQEAGVSSMTVSRVINGEKSVSDRTRERVRLAIKELKYSPNPAARSLASADGMRIGLIYSNPSATYLSEFLVGGLDECTENNVQMVLEKSGGDGDKHKVAEHLVASGIDGIILPPPLCDSTEIITLLADAGVPTVAVASGTPDARISAVGIDDFTAASTMTRHLVALGHRRIGFIAGHPNQTASARRLAGFRAAMAEAGIEPENRLIVQGWFSYRSGLETAEQLLSLPDRPTAIFASNDDMAAAAIAVAHRRHLDVPLHLSVCGFDDSPLATTIWPELTTIRQPIADMARAAVRRLIRDIRAKRAGEAGMPEHVRFDHVLVRRQSDGTMS